MVPRESKKSSELHVRENGANGARDKNDYYLCHTNTGVTTICRKENGLNAKGHQKSEIRETPGQVV